MKKFDLSGDVVTIYFSKDRPMQLDLALYSNQHNSEDWIDQEEIVIYRASSYAFEDAYLEVFRDHSSVTFVKENDFKRDLLNCVKDKKYVLFVVDDSIFVRPYSLEELCSLMETIQKSLGFSLRLGKNTKYCYPLARKNDMPRMQKLLSKMNVFDWTCAGVGDFSYPLELSSSLYRVDNLLPLLYDLDYRSPNSLEWCMSINANVFAEDYPFLMCYDKSRAFSNPINKIQAENSNRTGKNEEYSIASLLKKYQEGLRISYKEFDKFIPDGCHQEVDLVFYR